MKFFLRLFLCILSYFAFAEILAMDVDDFFPQIAGDYSNITWAHAVNSWTELNQSLNSNIMMLEADVSLGHVIGQSEDIKIPIMAHPPAVVSDISLDEWLNAVIKNQTKGAKFDFKSMDALELSLEILKSKFQKIHFPVWINADVLPGPVNATSTPMNVSLFLEMCKINFPLSTISPGWTTHTNATVAKSENRYSWNNVIDMALALRNAGIEQSVTFPVRAAFVGLAIDQLQWLVDSTPGGSLTVWSGSSDRVNVSDLLILRKTVALKEVFYDLPGSLNSEFSFVKFLPNNTPNASTRCTSILTKPYYNSDKGAIAGSRTVVLLGASCLTFTFPFKKILKNQRILKGTLEFLSSPPSDASMLDQYLTVSFGPDNASSMRIHANGRIEVPNGKGGWNVVDEGTSQFVFELFLPVDSLGNRVMMRLHPLAFAIDDLPYNSTHSTYSLYRPKGPDLTFRFESAGEKHKVISHLQGPCFSAPSRASISSLSILFITVSICIVAVWFSAH